MKKSEKTGKFKCPKCNSHLVLRNGKFGEFYGCFRYPKCKYTEKTPIKQIEQETRHSELMGYVGIISGDDW